jgi:hypothetical protein
MKKAILINPENNTITEVEIGEGISEIYAQIECRAFDIVRLGKKGKQENDVYVDDEGLLGEIKFGFSIGNSQPLAGKGLILGCNNQGESVDTNLTLEEAKSNVKIYPDYLSFCFAARAWSKKYE